MGAWDVGPFANDTAADWLAGLADQPAEGQPAFVEATLRRALPAGEYLEAPEGEESVAAAAIVAGERPGSERSITGEFETLKPLAKEALARVQGEDSELAELWQETDDAEAWHAELARIATALAGTGG